MCYFGLPGTGVYLSLPKYTFLAPALESVCSVLVKRNVPEVQNEKVVKYDVNLDILLVGFFYATKY